MKKKNILIELVESDTQCDCILENHPVHFFPLYSSSGYDSHAILGGRFHEQTFERW